MSQEVIETTTEVEQKQAELKAAWEALQSVPSYVEQQAAKFASEKEVKA